MDAKQARGLSGQMCPLWSPLLLAQGAHHLTAFNGRLFLTERERAMTQLPSRWVLSLRSFSPASIPHLSCESPLNHWPPLPRKLHGFSSECPAVFPEGCQVKLLAGLPLIPTKAAVMAASQELVWMSGSEFHHQEQPRPGMCCSRSLLANVEAPAAL